MSIHKRNGKRGTTYEVRYRGIDGREHSKTLRTRKEAEAYERDQLSALARGTWTDPVAGRVTLKAWADEWSQTIVHLAGSSMKIYESNLRLHILPVLGAHQLGRITTPMCRAWLSELMVKPKRGGGVLSPASVHQAYRTLHTVMASAVENGFIGRNPLDGVKPPRVPQTPMKFLTPEQVHTLANEIDPRYRAFVLLGAYCGLRAGEMLALTWDQVRMLERRVEVTKQTDASQPLGAVKAPKTAAGRRSVSLPRVVADALAEHALLANLSDGTQGPRTGLVFTSARGGPVDLHNLRQRTWAPAVKKAGLAGLRIHDLRHTYASLAISTGASVKVIQQGLGHASAAMTLDRYGHLLPSEAEAVADRLDDLARSAM